ncbi:hypothetical protein DEO72_LG2g4316 [Vigna unguiculata]|uniref:Uncharacterized protein n=1 Tax=Vigna unguiculata TaxID=3917 RepID=A0A4D6L619_VIGUN|nr:hypothetical protein DEO72_LG2g4316 [Vigna unguiculata]
MATLEWDVEAENAAARQGATARIEEREKMVYCANRRGREKGQAHYQEPERKGLGVLQELGEVQFF